MYGNFTAKQTFKSFISNRNIGISKKEIDIPKIFNIVKLF